MSGGRCGSLCTGRLENTLKININAMSLTYRIRSLIVDISGPRKQELRDCIDNVRRIVSTGENQVVLAIRHNN